MDYRGGRAILALMRRKKPSTLSELGHQQMVEAARAFCRSLNDLSGNVSATSADHRVISDLNQAVLVAVKEVTGRQAPWLDLTPGSSYPDSKPAHE